MGKLKNISKEFFFNMSFNSAWGYVYRLQLELKANRVIIDSYSAEIDNLKEENEELKQGLSDTLGHWVLKNDNNRN